MKTVYTILLATVVAVGLGCGYGMKNSSPTPGIVPAISQLSPNSAMHGKAGFTLTVNGTQFATNAAVNWNGAAQATAFVSGGQLTVSIPASMIATAGSAKVTVTNPATMGGGMYGGGGTMAETSAPMTFRIQ
jgi:hypothetical protein